MPPRFSLRKKERLKSPKIISSLFAQGKATLIYPLRVVWLPVDRVDIQYRVEAAFSVAARRFPKATDRNRIKRQMRESYRLNKRSLYEVLEQQNNRTIAVIFIYVAPSFLNFAQINTAMQNALRYLCQNVSVVK